MLRINYICCLIALYSCMIMFTYVNADAGSDAAVGSDAEGEDEIISMEHKLYEHLKKIEKHISKSLLPVKELDKAINVSFSLLLHRILSIDEREEKITVQVSKKVVWINEKLTWNPKEWGNITRIAVHHKNIWAPEFTLLSNAYKDAPIPHKGTDYVFVYYTGKNVWCPVVTLSAEFRMDITYFPFDLQTCEIKFSSWVLNASKLRIVESHDELVKHDFRSAEWRVVEAKQIITKERHEDEYIYEVKFDYKLVRKSWYYIITLIVPCFILIFIQLFSYFLPAKSGERMGVIITVLLVFAVFLEAIRSSLPQNADATSVLAIFYLTAMMVSTISFLSNCIVVSLLQEKSKMPPWFIRRYIIKTIDTSESECIPLTSEGQMRSSDDALFRKLTDRKQHALEELPTDSNEQMAVVCKLDAIEKMLALITVKLDKEVKENEKQKQINEEWETFAVKMDIICFYLFSILFAMTSLVILMPAYNRYNGMVFLDEHHPAHSLS